MHARTEFSEENFWHAGSSISDCFRSPSWKPVVSAECARRALHDVLRCGSEGRARFSSLR